MSNSQTFRGFWGTLILPALIVAISISCSQQIWAETIHFDFEDMPTFDEGDGKNPIFEQEGFQLEFSGVPIWVAQWVDDNRSRPFSGIGSMRLTNTGGTPFLTGEGRVNFTTPAESVELYSGVLVHPRVTVPTFLISAYGVDGNVLATASIRPSGDLSAPIWARVNFDDLGPIQGLSFSGMSNNAYWDDLTVTLIPEPTTASLILAGFMLLANHRRFHFRLRQDLMTIVAETGRVTVAHRYPS